MGGISYNGVHREVLLERGTFFRLQVYERVKESIISDCKRAQMGYPMYFMALNSSRKRSGLMVTEEAFAGKLQDKFSLHFSLS